MKLSDEWESEAERWIAWARTPGHDSYWVFHRDVFFELLPAPGRRTLDVGCGEGRVSRDLAALGHRVTGVDASPTLVRAAREASPELEFGVADAAALPFEDGAFDLVVAFMLLHDLDAIETALAEAARVLGPGGVLCAAVVHPINSAGTFTTSDDDSPFVIDGSYLERARYAADEERDGLTMRFVSEHRPLQDFVNPVIDAGFRLERVREVTFPPAIAAEREGRGRWLRVPLFLHLRARRSA